MRRLFKGKHDQSGDEGQATENPRFESDDAEAHKAAQVLDEEKAEEPAKEAKEDEDDPDAVRKSKVKGLQETKLTARSEKKSLFLLTLEEKRHLQEEQLHHFKQDVKAFDENASVKRMEVKMELETDMDAFFKQAITIVKQTRSMDEAQLLEKLGLEQEDKFTGSFGFANIAYGESTMNDVSSMFRPRRDPGNFVFRQAEDGFDNLCASLSRTPPPINYDPFTDKEYKHWQKRYMGLHKIIARNESETEMNLDIHKVWVDDPISMKLLSEFVWRHLDQVTSVDAEKAVGFKKRDCLMFMQALKECKNLKTIDFDHTELCKEGSAGLALIAKVSANLGAVSLVNSSTMDAGAAFWGLALATGCPNLQTLDLSHGKIGPSGATALAIGLSKHQNLKILNLSHNLVGRPGCIRLGEALLVNPILEELNLTGNGIGSRGAASLSAFIIHPKCKLKTLVLVDNDIGRNGGKALSVGLSYNKSIITLDLAENDLGEQGAAGFGVCLEKNNTLRSLNMADCDITDLGAAGVAFGLRRNTCLRTLVLSQQIIGDSGCTHIANMLGANTSSKLHSLDLSTNVIRDAGAIALAEMLKTNHRLYNLQLGDNEIEDEGAKALGEVLSAQLNKTLKTLDLSENPISKETGETYLSKAERRLITQNTTRLDVVAQGTSMARSNLRGCGVIVLRSHIERWYAIVYGVLSLISAWGNFASQLLVIRNTVTEAYTTPTPGNAIYAFLTVFFLVVPYFYTMIIFSLPEAETDIAQDEDEDDDDDDEAKKPKKQHALHQSSLLLGRSAPGTSSDMSFSAHLIRVSTTRCDQSRFRLFLHNLTVTRIPYEVYLGYKAGMTTLAMASIRLSNLIFATVPQSIVQLHILLSAENLQLILSQGGLVGANGDDSALVLVVSVSISVSILSSTLSGLFEEKFVVNWSRVAMANETRAFWIGYFTAYFYHYAHYLYRAFTIVLIASIFAAPVAIPLVLAGIFVRLIIHWITGSERRRTFAIVSYLVGVASWDKRRAARLVGTFEFLETVIVIAPLWMPLDVIQTQVNTYPLVFQNNYYTLASIVGPVFFTSIIYATGGFSFIVYLLFIARIHPYKDVPHPVDDVAARAMAEAPFEDHTKILREGYNGFFLQGGKAVLSTANHTFRSSALKLSSSLRNFTSSTRKAAAGRPDDEKAERHLVVDPDGN